VSSSLARGGPSAPPYSDSIFLSAKLVEQRKYFRLQGEPKNLPPRTPAHPFARGSDLTGRREIGVRSSDTVPKFASSDGCCQLASGARAVAGGQWITQLTLPTQIDGQIAGVLRSDECAASAKQALVAAEKKRSSCQPLCALDRANLASARQRAGAGLLYSIYDRSNTYTYTNCIFNHTSARNMMIVKCNGSADNKIIYMISI